MNRAAHLRSEFPTSADAASDVVKPCLNSTTAVLFYTLSPQECSLIPSEFLEINHPEYKTAKADAQITGFRRME
jgi:hypothetical protein